MGLQLRFHFTSEKTHKVEENVDEELENEMNVNVAMAVVLTVSVVFSKRWPSRHQVITAGGRDPALWHNRSYRRPADNGWWAPSNRIFNGVTNLQINLWKNETKQKWNESILINIFLDAKYVTATAIHDSWLASNSCAENVIVAFSFSRCCFVVSAIKLQSNGKVWYYFSIRRLRSAIAHIPSFFCSFRLKCDVVWERRKRKYLRVVFAAATAPAAEGNSNRSYLYIHKCMRRNGRRQHWTRTREQSDWWSSISTSSSHLLCGLVWFSLCWVNCYHWMLWARVHEFFQTITRCSSFFSFSFSFSLPHDASSLNK